MAWVIGDIHGCLKELTELLDNIPGRDELIFVGDYIDRGPNSSEVIDRLLLEENRSIFLRGNHESMMIDFFLNPSSQEGMVWLHPPNGGRQTLQSYRLAKSAAWTDLPDSHRSFLESTKVYHEDKDFIAVHAGLNVKASLKNQSNFDLLWIRSDWIMQEAKWKGKHVYYGHTPSEYINGNNDNPIYGKKSTGVDTGCVYGGFLTAINTQTQDLIQVKAAYKYY